jgi:hypothetical protein
MLGDLFSHGGLERPEESRFYGDSTAGRGSGGASGPFYDQCFFPQVEGFRIFSLASLMSLSFRRYPRLHEASSPLDS